MSLAPFKAFIRPREAVRAKVYPDGDGRPTVGIGFNLNRKGAAAALARVGLRLMDVLAGQPLTAAQIDALFDTDVGTSHAEAVAHFPSFHRHPAVVQMILVDLVFNMGLGRLAEFQQFRRDIEARRYASAAGELMFTKPPSPKLSEYFTDTKTRARANMALLFDVARDMEGSR